MAFDKNVISIEILFIVGQHVHLVVKTIKDIQGVLLTKYVNDVF